MHPWKMCTAKNFFLLKLLRNLFVFYFVHVIHNKRHLVFYVIKRMLTKKVKRDFFDNYKNMVPAIWINY